jgi:phage tail tape-measure protein
MTPAQTALCAMLFGGMIGSGSVVAVNKVSAKQETAKPKKDRGVQIASRPRVVRPEPAPRPGPSILDCPTPVIVFN